MLHYLRCIVEMM